MHMFDTVGAWLYRHFQRHFWEAAAGRIHAAWGMGSGDYHILQAILATIGEVHSLIDLGCGSGRLFPLYLAQRIPNIVGVDISSTALAVARREYPEVMTYRIRLEDLEDLGFPDGHFDLGISSRTLQHVPPENFAQVVKSICALCRWVYVNELSESDNVYNERSPRPFYLFHHNYLAKFATHGFRPYLTNTEGRQSYWLFGPADR